MGYMVILYVLDKKSEIIFPSDSKFKYNGNTRRSQYWLIEGKDVMNFSAF